MYRRMSAEGGDGMSMIKMQTGLLWFDNDAKRCLADKLTLAAEYYERKLGERPNTCFVNDSMVKDGETACSGIVVVKTHDVLPNHFWLGVVKPRHKAREQ